jgi:cyclic pyranopterin phosphate synthase
MPEEHYVWLPRRSILDYEELARLAAVFAGFGVEKVRITGGEPLLRRDLSQLVALLRADARLTDVALTTNGLLLPLHAADLASAGLNRLTVSLDTLRAERYRDLTGRARLQDALAGIDAVLAAGFRGTKLNTVVMRGVNDDELIDLLEFGRAKDLEVRFIEYMDVGGATRWSPHDVVSRSEILEIVRRHYGSVEPAEESADARAPADRFLLPDGSTFGVIASTTAPFCRSCGRSRLTADGMWYLCLYADDGVDLKALLRGGASDADIAAAIREAWERRTDRGAEQRLDRGDRGPLYRLQGLREDPHREMHTRGG